MIQRLWYDHNDFRFNRVKIICSLFINYDSGDDNYDNETF